MSKEEEDKTRELVTIQSFSNSDNILAITLLWGEPLGLEFVQIVIRALLADLTGFSIRETRGN